MTYAHPIWTLLSPPPLFAAISWMPASGETSSTHIHTEVTKIECARERVGGRRDHPSPPL